MKPCTACSEATLNTNPQLCARCRKRAEDAEKTKDDILNMVIGDLT